MPCGSQHGHGRGNKQKTKKNTVNNNSKEDCKLIITKYQQYYSAVLITGGGLRVVHMGMPLRPVPGVMGKNNFTTTVACSRSQSSPLPNVIPCAFQVVHTTTTQRERVADEESKGKVVFSVMPEMANDFSSEPSIRCRNTRGGGGAYKYISITKEKCKYKYMSILSSKSPIFSSDSERSASLVSYGRRHRSSYETLLNEKEYAIVITPSRSPEWNEVCKHSLKIGKIIPSSSSSSFFFSYRLHREDCVVAQHRSFRRGLRLPPPKQYGNVRPKV
eukprot:gene10736-7465_t